MDAGDGETTASVCEEDTAGTAVGALPALCWSAADGGDVKFTTGETSCAAAAIELTSPLRSAAGLSTTRGDDAGGMSEEVVTMGSGASGGGGGGDDDEDGENSAETVDVG